MLLNILGFNSAWFGLILIGNSFIPVALFWLALHIYRCEKPLAEFKLIISITIVGVLVDSTLLFFDVLVFNQHSLMPFWLIMLWASFAATIAHSLNILAWSKTLQFCIGFIFPPLSYIAGSSLSSVEFGNSLVATYFIFAFIWAGLMMLFFHFKKIFYSQESVNA